MRDPLMAHARCAGVSAPGGHRLVRARSSAQHANRATSASSSPCARVKNAVNEVFRHPAGTGSDTARRRARGRGALQVL